LFSGVEGIIARQIRNRDNNLNYKNWEISRKEILRSKLKLLEISLNVKSGIENIVGSDNSFCRSVN
jgi:hypothetical protein